MDTLPYQQAFDRIRAEYLEMPGMRLTPLQVQRLTGVDRSVCKVVLDDLVRAEFLRLAPDGSYARAADGTRSGRGVPTSAPGSYLVSQGSRRAG